MDHNHDDFPRERRFRLLACAVTTATIDDPESWKRWEVTDVIFKMLKAYPEAREAVPDALRT